MSKKKKKGDRRAMATQIAPTPMLHGNEAKQVYHETKIKMNADATRGAQKLSDMFSKMIKR